MAGLTRHLLQQGPVVAALGRSALMALAQQLDREREPSAPPTPGPVITELVAPRPRGLVNDLVRWSGGEPRAYRGVVPPYLFPQWGFPLQSRTLDGISYPLTRILNAGCRMTVHAPIPADETLQISAQLTSVDDDGRRAILHQRLVTGTASVREALTCEFQALVPLERSAGKKRERPRVPRDVKELAFWRLGPRAGLEFALLTGDFNPVHWIGPYARAAGFRSTILHGFATMARTIEGLNRTLWAGDVDRLKVLDVRFVRPLILPAKVGLYIDGVGGVWVGDAPGGPAYMQGTYALTLE
jgi:acyl dehydratase